MSQFSVNFIVDSKYLGDVMEVLQPYKIEDLGFKLVAGTPTKVRQGDKPAWELAAGLADATPRPLAYFKERILAAGFRKGTVYNALREACSNKALVRKMVDGKPNYIKGK